MKRKIQVLVLSMLLATFAYFSCQIYAEAKPLQIIFLDVGQGDSILIQKGTQQILIDGGPSGKTELAELGKYLPYFDREIDTCNRDSSGQGSYRQGLLMWREIIKIGKVLATGAEKDTADFQRMERYALDIIKSKRFRSSAGRWK